MKITLVAGARPNFMKIAPLIRAIEERQSKGFDLHFRLVHTGQHFDAVMSTTFFEQLGIPTPDVNLGAGGGTQAEQTASVMIGFERELQRFPTDLVIVVGDVTSTMAATITAKKLGISVAHVEAGIRSGDMQMPEEINRMVTDAIADEFYTTTAMAATNLKNMQVNAEQIHFVGNTMIDTLYHHLDGIRQPDFWDDFGLSSGNYLLITLHRPSNVDDPEKLQSILTVLEQCSRGIPMIFPVHPRTQKTISSLSGNHQQFKLTGPQGYLEFMYLIKNARGVITDSGGITEEATVLSIPCITLRDATERPETVSLGTNELVGDDLVKLQDKLDILLAGQWKKGTIPALWDGKTADRIIDKIIERHAVEMLVPMEA
jgi:UDP-N-acetylglucosamine 2-epimerase (non-hydrolysing)